mmetsp:Transcript_99502/g.251079  ORF Transcript_99502/g.251079 Transcript_99502/m.251079 type:complete len:381 (-) Transcript_99502:701-1843(-)
MLDAWQRADAVEHVSLDLLVRQAPIPCDGALVEDAAHVLRGEPEAEPLAHDRLDLQVIELLVQKHEVRVTLQVMQVATTTDGPAETIQDLLGAQGILQVLRDAVLVDAEETVQQMEHQVPPFGRMVDQALLPDREVELGLQGVQHKVDLINHANAPLQLLQHPPHLHTLPPHLRCVLLGSPVICHSQRLEEPELQGFHISGCAEHDVALGADTGDARRKVYFQVQGAVALEGRDTLLHDCGECVLHHRSREHDQRLRHHQANETRTFGQHKCQQRRDHGGLACPHDHLLNYRGARKERLQELRDHLDLPRPQEEACDELEDQEARVELRLEAGGARDVRDWREEGALRAEESTQNLGLLGEACLQSNLRTCAVWVVEQLE